MKFISSKINIFRIIESHTSTIKYQDKFNKADVWTFYIIPCTISLFLLTIKINDNLLNMLGIILTILIGLFLNLLILLISYNLPIKISDKKKELLLSIKKETFYNVSYIIIICTLELLLLLIYIYIKEYNYLSNILSSLIYFLTIHIFLILLMILKRIFIIFDNTI